MLSSPVENTPNHPRNRITCGSAASANADHEMKIATRARHAPALVAKVRCCLGAWPNRLFASHRSFRPICAVIVVLAPDLPTCPHPSSATLASLRGGRLCATATDPNGNPWLSSHSWLQPLSLFSSLHLGF